MRCSRPAAVCMRLYHGRRERGECGPAQMLQPVCGCLHGAPGIMAVCVPAWKLSSRRCFSRSRLFTWGVCSSCPCACQHECFYIAPQGTCISTIWFLHVVYMQEGLYAGRSTVAAITACSLSTSFGRFFWVVVWGSCQKRRHCTVSTTAFLCELSAARRV